MNAAGGCLFSLVLQVSAALHDGRTRLVQTWYQNYLGRQAHNGEEQGWVQELGGSAGPSAQREKFVLGQFLATGEFFQRAQTLIGTRSANERYVQALYGFLLDRTASAGEVAGWVQVLQQAGRQAIAAAFLNSGEYHMDLIEAYYNTLLHRRSDALGVADWLMANAGDLGMRLGFEASGEFFTNGYWVMVDGPRSFPDVSGSVQGGKN